MVPEAVRKKAEIILKNKDFSDENGDEIEIVAKGDGLYYAYVKSKNRGSFGQIIISSDDLSFFWGGSAMNPEVLLERYKAGMRSMPKKAKKLRMNVLLPTISDNEEILSFAKKLTDTFVDLSKNQDVDYYDEFEDYWYKMLYNGLVLLLSARESDTKVIQLTMLFHSSELVRSYLKTVTVRDVYEYWTLEVPRFMDKSNARDLVHRFDVRVASLIGEQEIQDLCNNYRG